MAASLVNGWVAEELPEGRPPNRAFCSQVESLGVAKCGENKNLERFRVSVKNGNALMERRQPKSSIL